MSRTEQNSVQRLASILNVRPGEERAIGLLVLLYFVLALGFVFVQSMAFGVFLAEYGPEGLPYSYISIAVLASLAAFIYIKLGERVAFARSLLFNLTFLTGLTFLAWLGLRSSISRQVAFLLPLLFQIVVNLGNLVVWPLAGRLFDFRQAKRLFPLLGVGLWLANSIGGLLVAPLVALMGVNNLLLLAVVSIASAVIVLRVILDNYKGQVSPPQQAAPRARAARRSGGLPQDRYVSLILTYMLLWWTVFFFLDNIFSDRAAAQFPDVGQLTAFMGQLLSVTGVVALIFSTFLNGRIIGRFGLRAGLTAMPLLVTFIVGALAISTSLGASLAVVFILAALAKLINVALGFSLSQSANAIVYQSLPDALRRRVQATAEGIVQPLATGVAGIGLLALIAVLKLDFLALSYVFLGLAAVWLAVIVLLSNGYVGALTQAITKRRLGASAPLLADATSVGLLRDGLGDPHPGAALYALARLDELDPHSVLAALPHLTLHPAPEVRREAFARIEASKLRSALDAVRNQMSVESEATVKAAGLRAMGAIADIEARGLLEDALRQDEHDTLRGALVGLLKYGDGAAARQRLDHLLGSSDSSDRTLAARVLGELPGAAYREAHRILLHDPDPAVRREALRAVAKSRPPELLPLLIQACDSAETGIAASHALIGIGANALPGIASAFAEPDASHLRLMALARALGRIGGSEAEALLISRMETPDLELRLQVLKALSRCGYRAQDSFSISAAIDSEVRLAAWLSAAQVELDGTEAASLLVSALEDCIAKARERVLLLLSFELDTESILRVREIWRTRQTAQLAYALEIIETQLPTDRKPLIMPLVEDLTPQNRLQRLVSTYPQTKRSTEEYLKMLIDGPEGRGFPAWTQACAIHTAARLAAHSCREPIGRLASHPDRLISETAAWAREQLAPQVERTKESMLSTVEKVLILKTVDVFEQTPDDVLAEVADLLEQFEVPEGATIFEKGKPGDSMYVIVDGKVRVHDDERLMSYLDNREVFGEMALLDSEPRSASVTAVEPTRLFRLDQYSFYQLIAERPEVATGIIRVLTRRLRNQAREMAGLDQRLKELQEIPAHNAR